ncbi:Pimeloyl-ACP methyl ester carboxylesterase [Bacillus sp. OV322]|uniref:alpha/beta fold hydrolase n=1 Tax=Bacillus sp. OV322 TaxID=1882764 RepID=UPI0008E457E5|nr:alpha/beta hydrolase [Bacillus sp. OV322]SFC29918.1 Pimeloyl-ACP methyl ester carboxylesterase [Bacillus sp. OV322]
MALNIEKSVHNINGTELYVERFEQSSSAPVLVLLHGFLSSSFSFRRLIPYLADDFTVISIDLPPFGQSGKSTSFTYSCNNLAMTVIQYLEAEGVKSCCLAGHSMGGQISMYVMKNRPDLISDTVLLCSSSYLPGAQRHLKYISHLPFFPYLVRRRLEKTGIEKNLQNVVYNQNLIDDDMRTGYLTPFLDNQIFKALAKMLRDREGDLAEQDLHNIQTRCLLIWGEHDKVVPLTIGQRLHRDLPNSSLIVIKDTGHLLPEEQPEMVHRYMRDFFLDAK